MYNEDGPQTNDHMEGCTTKWGCCTHKMLHPQKEKRLKTRVDEVVVDETGVDKLGVIIQPTQVQMTFSV